MAHELIHAFDHCRFKVDWNNLRHHACSEVSLLEGASACYDN
jgi:inner membrane protease ATP23